MQRRSVFRGFSADEYFCGTKCFSSCLNTVCVNFISGRSQFDSDMIPHMITFGYLRGSPEVRVAYHCRSRRSSEGWSSVKPECWWLIRWHVVVPPGASPLPAFFSSYSQIHTQTHTLNVLAYLRGNESPHSNPAQSFCFSLLFIYSQSFIWEMESEQLPPLTCCSSGDV